MSVTPPPSAKNEEMICLWKQCNRNFEDPELLYQHLANDHVGRKSTGNLCLKCHWDKCEVQTSKRDHITSHLRVHVPLKPHVCPRCRKAFKRPQDLKKHEKIHSEEHQASILGKNSRHSKNNQPPTPPQNPIDDPSISYAASPPQIPPSPESETSDSGEILIPYILDYANFSQNTFDIDNYNFNNNLPTNITKHNHKRSVDFMDEFIQDVKRNKIEPHYSEGLMNKLENLNQAISGDDINTINFSKDDWVMVNDFMKQVLKDIEITDMGNSELNINSGLVNPNIYPDSFPIEELNGGSLYPSVEGVIPSSIDNSAVEKSALDYSNSYNGMFPNNITLSNVSYVYPAPIYGISPTPCVMVPQRVNIYVNNSEFIPTVYNEPPSQKGRPSIAESVKKKPKGSEMDELIEGINKFEITDIYF
ncbi:35259_t:CDS:2 [Gigaspora margarita]|uniref:35259_t:CDS:1 n=1 Tax=Gigaspora margarita TaxID=4874 RepID=A0ABN7VR76_GIGMA|nr:35259_t:CDS:2 [Gigaspora margarita]